MIRSKNSNPPYKVVRKYKNLQSPVRERTPVLVRAEPMVLSEHREGQVGAWVRPTRPLIAQLARGILKKNLEAPPPGRAVLPP